MAKRVPWNVYFLRMADLARTRSTCIRRQVGAVAVRNHRILATGYNGSPSGIQHCLDIGCQREELVIPSGQRHEICRGLHAEQNVIIQAALEGISLRGCVIYCTNQPCIICLKMLLNLEISELIYQDPYPDPMSLELLEQAAKKVRDVTVEDVETVHWKF